MTSKTGSSARNWILFFVLFLVTQLPLYLVDYPDIQDYVNHVARLHIALNMDLDDNLARYYSWFPGIFPNMPLDTIGLALAYFVGPQMGVKLFASLSVLVVTSGCVALSRSLLGTFSPIVLGVFLFVSGDVLYYGLLNYIFGIGLALWLIAAWVVTDRLPPIQRGAWFSLGATCLYLAHLSALAFYLIAITILTFRPLPFAFCNWTRKSLLIVSQLTPPLCIHLLIYDRPIPLVEEAEWNFLQFLLRKIALLSSLTTKNVSAYPTLSIPVGVILILGIYATWKRRLWELCRPATGIVVVLLLCMSILPLQAFGSSLLDARLLFPIGLVAWSGLAWSETSARAHRHILSVVSG